MLRHTMVVMLITLSTMLLSSNQTSAFTLGFGPVEGNRNVSPGSEDADVPTPQLIRIAIGTSGVTVGAISPTDGYRTSGPALELRTPNIGPATEPAALQQQSSRRVQKSTAAYQLSGAELLLLRKTSIVADRQAD